MIWDDHFAKLKNSLNLSKDSVTIISPYMSQNTLELLITDIKVPVKILTSWQIDDFTSGLAKTSLAEKCLDKGWEIHVFHGGHKRKLHTKAYISDSKNIWIGSANLTDKGLGINKNPNFEMMIMSEFSEDIKKHIDFLFSISSRVDKNLIEEFKKLEKLIPEKDIFELDWEAPFVIDGLTIPSQILESIGGRDIFEKLWSLMPSRPDVQNLEPGYSEENNLHLIGCRWGQFRQALRDMDIERDFIDEKIKILYDWAINEYGNILDVKTGGRGNYTQCLVWKL